MPNGPQAGRQPKASDPNSTKGARIYCGEKTIYSISGARKTRQLHVKERD